MLKKSRCETFFIVLFFCLKVVFLVSISIIIWKLPKKRNKSHARNEQMLDAVYRQMTSRAIIIMFSYMYLISPLSDMRVQYKPKNVMNEQKTSDYIGLKITEKVSFNIASEASYNLSGLKLLQNVKNVQFGDFLKS